MEGSHGLFINDKEGRLIMRAYAQKGREANIVFQDTKGMGRMIMSGGDWGASIDVCNSKGENPVSLGMRGERGYLLMRDENGKAFFRKP